MELVCLKDFHRATTAPNCVIIAISLELPEQLEILLERSDELTIINGGGRMVLGCNFNGSIVRHGIIYFSMRNTNWLYFKIQIKFFHNIIHRISAKGYDYFWLYKSDLPIKKWPINGNFLRKRVAIFRWTILKD